MKHIHRCVTDLVYILTMKIRLELHYFPYVIVTLLCFFYTGTSFKLACIGSSLLCYFLFRMLQTTSQNPDPLYVVKKRLELHYYDRINTFFLMLQ